MKKKPRSPLHLRFLELLEQTEAILRSSSSLSWMPLCKKTEKKSADTCCLVQEESHLKRSVSKKKLAPVELSAKKTSFSSFAPRDVAPPDEPENLKRLAEPLGGGKMQKKIGAFFLEWPKTTKRLEPKEEIARWFQKKGVGQRPEDPPLSLVTEKETKKSPLAPVLILYDPSSCSFESLQRLQRAIEEKLLPSLLLEERPENLLALSLALESGQVRCLLYQKKLASSSLLALKKEAIGFEEEDLIENPRKLRLWKRVLDLLRQPKGDEW